MSSWQLGCGCWQDSDPRHPLQPGGVADCGYHGRQVITGWTR